ncbi:Cytosolic phospholipase A2 zeta, variant 2 [Chamberlinius hualienensis]
MIKSWKLLREKSVDEGFDPFQVFEVTPEPCKVLKVTVVSGNNITKGWAGDMLDTPDPYVTLKVRFTPNSTKKTKNIDNNPNPIWNETFELFLDPNETYILDVTVMDSNYTIDEVLGRFEYDLSQLVLNKETEVVLKFKEGFTITLKMVLNTDTTPDLRYSLALCEDEKQFIIKRKHYVLKAMHKLLPESDAPKTIREVPTVGLLGSGGGFRAMVCLSGVIKALNDQDVWDCVAFAGCLSGSAWYLSTLYSHPDYPSKSPGELQEELKSSIDQSPFWLLNPQSLFKYTTNILKKKRTGQPVSFTDFFGLMLGDTLLVKRLDSLLTEQRAKLQDGRIPLPLYTCLHVKKDVMAKVFQEWIEFSPYEVGIAKYGTFMKTDYFGSKFYMGRIVKRYAEFPLHYLQGVWGSAFCILFRQLVKDKGKNNIGSMVDSKGRNLNAEHDLRENLETMTIDDDSEQSELDTDDEREHTEHQNGSNHENSIPKVEVVSPPEEKPTSQDDVVREKVSVWSAMMMAIMKSSFFNTLSGRAASIFNPLRGLTLNYLYPISPFSPTTPSDELEFKGTHEALSTENKTLYLVDGGLTFNSPYPLLLRPQRGVDVFLSFDFSARPSDNTQPFKEILLAEKWATTNNVPFPPIEKIVNEHYAHEPVRECYVFEHPNDPYCPIILHFVIINNLFKKFKAPYVERATDEEKDFANFSVFDDPEQPYSLFNFSYSHLQFERISRLMEFNTLLYVDLIKSTLAKVIERKRRTMPRAPISMADVANLKLKFKTKDAAEKLRTYVRSFSKKDKNEAAEKDEN